MKITIAAENDDDKKLLPEGEVVYEGVSRCLILMGANDKWLHATGKVDMVRADLGRAGRPRRRPRLLACAKPALTRSAIRARSNSEMAPKICI